MERVDEQLEQHILSRTLLDNLLREVVQKRQQQYGKLEDGIPKFLPSPSRQTTNTEPEPTVVSQEQAPVVIEVCEM